MSESEAGQRLLEFNFTLFYFGGSSGRGGFFDDEVEGIDTLFVLPAFDAVHFDPCILIQFFQVCSFEQGPDTSAQRPALAMILSVPLAM